MSAGQAEFELLKVVGVLGGVALALASPLVWRFEKMAREARREGAAARRDFLAALKEATGPRADGGVTWAQGR